MMNEHIRSSHTAGSNPWNFTHIKNLEIGRGAPLRPRSHYDFWVVVLLTTSGSPHHLWVSSPPLGLLTRSFAYNLCTTARTAPLVPLQPRHRSPGAERE
eukprot:4971612-Prymnesium_polylepis.1